MSSSFLIAVNLIIIGVITFKVWQVDKLKIFWWAIGFKLSCGILIGLLYKYYYTTGDTWTFQKESISVVQSLLDHPTQIFNFFWFNELAPGAEVVDLRPRSLFFTKWVSFFNLLDGSNYWITSLYFSLISFLGSWFFVRILNRQYSHLKLESVISFLFVPSIVLWGSGVIKESISIGFLFVLSGMFIDWYLVRKITIIRLVTVFISCWVLWNLKYYWLGIWLAVVIPLLGVQELKSKFQWIKLYPRASWLLLLCISIAAISLIRPNFYYDRLFAVVAENYNAFLAISQPQDVIHYYNLDSSFSSIIINSPWALISGLFRPFIFEASNIPQVIAALENFVLLVLFGLSIYRMPKINNMTDLLVISVVFYIIFSSIFLALSTPNFGTLSRYKIGFTPFLWYGLLIVSGVLFRFRKSI